jgi:hypothetical protein
MQRVSEYAHRWRFTFNNKNSNIVVIGSDDAKSVARNMTWLLAGKEVTVVCADLPWRGNYKRPEPWQVESLHR